MLKFTCINCRYVYSPYLGDEEQEVVAGTDFSDINEDWLCPVCGSSKDDFMELQEEIHDPANRLDLLFQEEAHIPFYSEKDGKVVIRLGTEDSPYVQDDVHFVEYIGLFDCVGDPIETVDFPDIESEIEFEAPDEDYEVRASCSLHGVWRGIKINEYN